jgi:hypothetical protein
MSCRYIERTNGGFDPFPINTRSPCLCRTAPDSAACSHEIDQYRLSPQTQEAEKAGVVRGEQCMSFDLADQRVVLFKDHINSIYTVVYHYTKKYADSNYYLLNIGHWEWSDYLLVNGNNGRLTSLPGPAELSPDNRHLAVAAPGLYSIEVWDVDEARAVYDQGWIIENFAPNSGMLPTLPTIRWTDKDSFQVVLPAGYGLPLTTTVTATVTLGPQGWLIYGDGKPIAQPVVDYRAITFANDMPRYKDMPGHRELLDKLQVGKPVYSDQPYRFTQVPRELGGATYFHIPQNYFLGESPDYFPLSAQMADYLDFQVMRPAAVYIGLGAIVDDQPDWMQAQPGWQYTPLDLKTDDIPLRFYPKHFAAGEWMKLVDKWMTKGRVPSQFVVIVTPDED